MVMAFERSWRSYHRVQCVPVARGSINTLGDRDAVAFLFSFPAGHGEAWGLIHTMRCWVIRYSQTQEAGRALWFVCISSRSEVAADGFADRKVDIWKSTHCCCLWTRLHERELRAEQKHSSGGTLPTRTPPCCLKWLTGISFYLTS
jgi:hypothetical protein